MVRTLVVPDQQNISIHLPESYVGKTVEIIAFEVNESEVTAKKRTMEEITNFYKGMQLDLSTYKFDRDEANER